MSDNQNHFQDTSNCLDHTVIEESRWLDQNEKINLLWEEYFYDSPSFDNISEPQSYDEIRGK
jgi:hypothetical protein